MSQTIFERLRADHDSQRQLFAELEATSGNTAERRSLWKGLKTELVAHAATEERIFYSPLLAERSARKEAKHAIHEHAKIDDLIAAVDDIEADNPHWIRRVQDLHAYVEHHLTEEEHGMFQLAGRVLSEGKKEEMAITFDAIKPEERARA